MSSHRSVGTWEPITWWGHTWRVLLAGACGQTLLLLAADPVVARQVRHDVVVRDLAVGLLSLVLLPLHRRSRVIVPLLLQAMTAVSVTSTGAAQVALASVATRRRWILVAANVLVALPAAWIGGALYPARDPRPAWFDLGVLVFSFVATIAWGLYIGTRRDLIATWRWRAENADAEQARRVAAAQTDERARIAREMHDVLAHRLSLVSMHAGALAYRTDLSREEVQTEAQIIRQTSAEALAELRGILGVLRATPVGVPESSTDAPQPTYADLPALVRDTGTPVTLVDDLPPGSAPPTAVGRHVYRMVQEALTNVRKHAPDTESTVRLGGAPGGDLLVEVTNTRPARLVAPTLPGGGLGLVGLAERATIVGGTLEHGPTPDGGYRVRASLPWPQESS